MIGPKELLIFIALVTGIILAVTAAGYYYFTKWAVRERTTGRRHIDSHVAEVFRQGPSGSDDVD